MLDLDSHLSDIVAGDARAFARWVAGAELPLRTQLRRFAAVVDVEAVLQEALLRTWQLAPRLAADGRPNGLLRLAARIARNLAIDLARRQRVHADASQALLDAATEAPEPRPPDPLLRELVTRCREALPEKPAAALGARLSGAGAEPDRVLAARLQMQLNTFLQNVTRARRLLDECLRKRGVDLSLELT